MIIPCEAASEIGPPRYVAPLIPTPPVTTKVPVVVEVDAVLAVIFTAPDADSVVNAPAAGVAPPIAGGVVKAVVKSPEAIPAHAGAAPALPVPVCVKNCLFEEVFGVTNPVVPGAD
jgi:hypothetical protein